MTRLGETCSSPWQLYIAKKAFIVWCSLCFRVIYLLSPLSYYHICSGSVFHRISSLHMLCGAPSFFFLLFFLFPSHARSLSWISPRRPPLGSPLPPPPLPGADWAVFSSLNQWACCCRVILYKPTPRSWDTVRDAVRFTATVRPTSMRLKKILCGLCSVQGGFPISPPPTLFTGSCWEMQIYWHPPQSITAVWHPLLKHMLYYWTCMWFD